MSVGQKKLTAKKYLEQIQDLDISINQDLERLNDRKTDACSIGGIDYGKEMVQASSSGDSLCNAVIGYNSFENDISAEIERFVRAKNQIIGQIRGMHNRYYNQVLFKVYVQYKNIKVTSDEMGMSYQHVRNIHKKALIEFERMYDNLQYLT